MTSSFLRANLWKKKKSDQVAYVFDLSFLDEDLLQNHCFGKVNS